MSAAENKAVFLSYASQDAVAAQRICDALRTAGIEVWFDQNELGGGDAWDRKIRKQIADCALFVPVISAATQARHEGYFRLEWKLAAQRTHMMSGVRAFLLPVVVDGTRDAEAHVPDEFREVQWTRLPGGETPQAFSARVNKLLGGSEVEPGRPRPAQRDEGVASPASAPAQVGRRVPAAAWGIAALAAVFAAGGYFWSTRTPVPAQNAGSGPRPPTSEKAAVTSAISEKSLAVLPFANLSTEKENEFFADGMHDELLSALAKVGTLKVISRTSVLAYRDPAKRGLTLRQIAAELGVANILEGTVSRAAGSVRIKVKLIDAATDQPRWEDTINLKAVTDVFQAQADISAQIAQALAATLSPELKLALAKKLTTNPAAYDLYLRARRWWELGRAKLRTIADYDEAAIGPLEQAVALDPKFAAAYAELSQVHSHLYFWPDRDPTPERLKKAKETADKALLIDPALPVAHLALGYYYYAGPADYARATEEFATALVAMPGDADALFYLGLTQRRQGRWAEATVNLERAFAINPRNQEISGNWVTVLSAQRFYARAEQAADRVLAIDPANNAQLRNKALARFARDGDRARYRAALEATRMEAGEQPPDPRIGQFRIAIEDGHYPEAVGIFVAAPELLDRDSPMARQYPVGADLHRYFSAATATGEQAKVRVRALAAIGRTRVEATERRDEWRQGARLAILHAYARQPDEARRLADRVLELMPMKRDSLDGTFALHAVSLVHLALNDRDRALALLDQALSVPSLLIANELRLEPWWAPLRDDPRFKAALAKAAPRD